MITVSVPNSPDWDSDVDTSTVHYQNKGKVERSKLKFLVPSVGTFFTPLLLEKAFIEQDRKRAISSRRFVAPVR